MADTPRTVLITGASRGIGRGIAEAFGRGGDRVVVNFASNADPAEDAADAVRVAGGEAVTVKASIASAADRERLLADTIAAFGTPDVLVNNAGVAPRNRADLLEASEDDYDFVMGTNLKGPYFLTQAVANAMLADPASPGRRSILNIGSISAYTASINRGEYCLSKAGMGMMTKLFADRLARHGIAVHELRPGVTATDMTASDAVKAKYDRLILEDEPGLTPIRRWGTPEDIGRAAVLLASGELPFSAGEVVNVDGGFHLRRL